ncbi:MAG TPA: GTPase domain-containing protein [Paucimonas sp.]|nr:GTPase domain-containing protein [Paucimonas sp.]
MAELDEQRHRLTIKLVYYGPALSGKTTNLTRLHDLLSPELSGDIMTLETEGDRTLFFDLLPLGFKAPSGLLVKFKVFTVPGQVAHDGTRKAVLSRADGVVFVADSQRNQAINNGASFDNLADNAKALGMHIESLPLVVQFNKRDLPDIQSEEEIRKRWADAPWPLFFASALAGEGVTATFRALLESVHDRLDKIYGLSTRHGLSRADLVAAIGGRS